MTDQQIREYFNELLERMAAAKTNLAKDSQDTVWAFGPWYGESPHFRCNFGGWDEAVLTVDIVSTRMPFEPFVDSREPTEEDRKWAEFYLTPPRTGIT